MVGQQCAFSSVHLVPGTNISVIPTDVLGAQAP